jgi:hypothetical protein
LHNNDLSFSEYTFGEGMKDLEGVLNNLDLSIDEDLKADRDYNLSTSLKTERD